MRPDVKHAWIRCSLLATVSLATLAARADDLCLPLAPGVPGMYGQPPDWSAGGGTFGKKLNDPRWTGAVREDFPVFGAGMMPEVAFRGLYSGGTKIYYSLQTLVDDGVTTDNDAVYVGFASSTTSARILKVTLKTPAVLAGDLTPGNRDLATYRW